MTSATLNLKPEELFGEIVRMYDLADNVMAAVAHDKVINREIQIKIVTPFITQAAASTQILAAYYTEVVVKKVPVTADLLDTMETAFRNFFIALRELTDEMEDKLLPLGENI